MLKWSPDSFVDTKDMAAPDETGSAFEPACPGASFTEVNTDHEPAAWVPDTHPAGAPLDQLEAPLREKYLATARASLQADFERERQALRAAHAAELQNRQDETRDTLESWSSAFMAESERYRETTAADLADLALAVAEKIIRHAVDLDRGILTRTLETVLYKMEKSSPLSVTLHPADAAWLTDQKSLRSRLNVGEVVPDRRITRGGCHVRAGGREWDGSIEGQIQTLATAVNAAFQRQGGDSHEA